MKTVFFLSLAIIFVAGFCPVTRAVITEGKEVSKYIGRKITIVGKVSKTKIPQILGVDVSSNEPDLRGKQAEATGILERFETTSAQVQKMDRIGIANRGAGVFYRLRNEKQRAQIVKDVKSGYSK